MKLQHQNLKSKYKSHLMSNRFSADLRSQRHEAPLQLRRTKPNWNTIIMEKGTMNKLKIMNTRRQMHKKIHLQISQWLPKDTQLEKKLNPNMPLKFRNGTSLASSAFRSDVHMS